MPDNPESKQQQEIDRRKYMADRMSRLRDAARQDRKYFGELVVGDAPARGRRIKPLLMVAAAAAVAVGGLVMAFSLLSGGGASSAGTPADGAAAGQPGGASSGGAAGAATPTGTAARVPSPADTPVPDVKSTDPGEGAIARGSIQALDSIDLLLRMPIRGPVRTIEAFGTARGGGDLVHAGIDIASSNTTPFEVVAACDGTVAGVQKLSGYGEFIVVDCGRNWRTVYAQLASTAVQTGTRVAAGVTVLGTSGRFLHFEIRLNGAPVDPASALAAAAAITPAPTSTATPTATATPAETRTPTKTADGGTPPAQTTGAATPPPPAATPAPPTPTPTASPTPTPARPAAKSPTPKPGIR